MPSPAVTVILPVHDGERYLQEAIDSIIHQDLPDWELVVIDNGSVDRTGEICRAAAEHDSRVTVLRLPAPDLVAALNAGLAAARGAFVARMDADDVSLPSRLRLQMSYLDRHPDVVAVGGAVDVVDENGAPVGRVRMPQQDEAIRRALLSGRTAMCHPTVVLRHDAIVRIGGYRVGSYPAEDLDLWMRLSREGLLANLPIPLLRYRRHGSAVSFTHAEEQARRTHQLVSAERRRHGLPPAPLASPPAKWASVTLYHLACAKLALRCGNRAAARRHAREAMQGAPVAALPYAVLIAATLPHAALKLGGVAWTAAHRGRTRASTSWKISA
ncbi:glycosyltransferase family 2 protein [Nocardioides zhouii]|uniref:glycosyltransferase family 2 protein n=1 Tax=Nocardioides zhouii TaxID=1168729 RepID=UPI0013EBE138|nr:glycosyltransferase [Nocardioides zhouii]